MPTLPASRLNPRAVAVIVVLLLLLSRASAPPGPPPAPKSGKLVAVIVRESLDQSTAFASLLFNLRDGSAAKWLSDKGHSLIVLDDDDTDASGAKHPILVKIAPDLQNKPLPALVICEQPTPGTMGKTLGVEQLSDTTTADNVVEMLTRRGG